MAFLLPALAFLGKALIPTAVETLGGIAKGVIQSLGSKVGGDLGAGISSLGDKAVGMAQNAALNYARNEEEVPNKGEMYPDQNSTMAQQQEYAQQEKAQITANLNNRPGKRNYDSYTRTGQVPPQYSQQRRRRMKLS